MLSIAFTWCMNLALLHNCNGHRASLSCMFVMASSLLLCYGSLQELEKVYYIFAICSHWYVDLLFERKWIHITHQGLVLASLYYFRVIVIIVWSMVSILHH